MLLLLLLVLVTTAGGYERILRSSRGLARRMVNDLTMNWPPNLRPFTSELGLKDMLSDDDDEDADVGFVVWSFGCWCFCFLFFLFFSFSPMAFVEGLFDDGGMVVVVLVADEDFVVCMIIDNKPTYSFW